MRFDIVHTLEIPQGATELTTSQLEQISGGYGYGENNCKSENHKKSRKHGHRGRYDKHNKHERENNRCHDCDC